MQGVIMSGVHHAGSVDYAVGGEPGSGFLLHQANGSWAVHSTHDEMLHWVHSHDGNLWMVGANGLILSAKNDGTIERHNPPDVSQELWGVFVLAEDDVWIVGGTPRATGTTGAIILHFNGIEWAQVPLPDLDRPCPALFKVWARSPQELYFVGANGVLLTYDGSTLSQVPLELGDDLVSIWGNETSVVVVGGRTRGVILNFTQSQWTTHLLNQTSGLNGIWLGDDTAIAVGHQGTIVQWSLDSPETPRISQPVPILLHGIFQADANRLIAVGGTLDQPQPWTPVMIESQP